MEIAQVFIHVNTLSWLSRLDEVLFGLLVTPLVLQEAGVLHMHVLELVLGVLVGHLEGLIEFVTIAQVFDQSIYEVHLQQHLHAGLWTQGFCPLLGELTGLLVTPEQLTTSDGLLPLGQVAVHLNC